MTHFVGSFGIPIFISPVDFMTSPWWSIIESQGPLDVQKAVWFRMEHLKAPPGGRRGSVLFWKWLDKWEGTEQTSLCTYLRKNQLNLPDPPPQKKYGSNTRKASHFQQKQLFNHLKRLVKNYYMGPSFGVADLGTPRLRRKTLKAWNFVGSSSIKR